MLYATKNINWHFSRFVFMKHLYDVYIALGFFKSHYKGVEKYATIYFKSANSIN